ncbi:MAG: IclR family transcriptional regulator, partial [Alphaproteobacteria bacterium]
MTDKAETNDMAMPARKRRRAAASRSGPPKFRVPSVEKALDVLELLSDSPQGMTMNEITGALGRTMGELYRIVVYLSQRGYIAQDPDTDRYALTLRLFELSHRHDPTDRLLKRAIPVLETIAFRTEQSCHLAVLHQSAVLVLASVPSPRPAGYSVRTGAVFPVSKTSSGVVILSFLPPDVQERFLSGFAASEQAALRRRMGEIAARGYDQRESSLVHGVNNLSAPVFDRSGVVAAITMGYI